MRVFHFGNCSWGETKDLFFRRPFDYFIMPTLVKQCAKTANKFVGTERCTTVSD